MENEGEQIGRDFYEKYGRDIETPIAKAVERMRAEGDGDSLCLLCEQLRVARELVLKVMANGLVSPFDLPPENWSRF
jgi:hypothetical protein